MNYISAVGQGYISCISNQKDIALCLVAIKTTTNTFKNQKFSKKVHEESAEAI